MSGQHRQLSSFVSLPRHSLDASPAAAATPTLEVKLTPRPVYPVRFAIVAEGLQSVSAPHLPEPYVCQVWQVIATCLHRDQRGVQRSVSCICSMMR